VSSLSPGLSPSTPPRPQHILDVAGGTGDIAFRLLHRAHALDGNPDVRVTVADINPSMLAVGAERARSLLPAGQQAALSFVEANAEDLTRTKPLATASGEETTAAVAAAAADPVSAATRGIPSNSIDLYTIAFGIRNVTNIPLALREAHRVLKPGGIFACLEFSHVDHPHHPLSLVGSVLNAAYKRWSFSAIPLIGQLVAGDRDSYQYLVESIERFPTQEAFRDMIVEAGFVVAGEDGGGGAGAGGFENLTGGVAAIHKGMKPLNR
jgi:2-methoxy-6-polyprenyl-1,4-benzoquinol methylase